MVSGTAVFQITREWPLFDPDAGESIHEKKCYEL